MLPRFSLAIRVVMPCRRNTGSLPHSRLSAQSASHIPACHSAQRSATLPASSSHVKPLQATPTVTNCHMLSNCGVKLPRQKLSEPMGHRRAQMLRRKTRLSGRSGQGDACEEQAQGNGKTTVRAIRHQARTRRGGGIPPTKHRDANGGCSAREETSFSPKGATSLRRLDPAPEGALRGLLRTPARASPSATRFARGICR